MIGTKLIQQIKKYSINNNNNNSLLCKNNFKLWSLAFQFDSIKYITIYSRTHKFRRLECKF